MTEELNLMDGATQEEDVNNEEENQEATEPENQEEAKEGARPEILDESYWDEESKEIKLESLVKDLETEKKKALDLRKIISQKGAIKPPKEVTEYTLSEELKDSVPDDSDFMSVARDKALDAGLSKDQFSNFLSNVIPALREKGIIKEIEPELSEEEQQAQFKEYMQAELGKLGKDGQKVLNSVSNWGKGMVNKGVLSQDELPVFNKFAADAESLVVLNKIMSLTGEQAIPTKTAVVEGLPSRAEVDQIIASEAYQKGDAKAHKIVTNYFQAVSA